MARPLTRFIVPALRWTGYACWGVGVLYFVVGVVLSFQYNGALWEILFPVGAAWFCGVMAVGLSELIRERQTEPVSVRTESPETPAVQASSD